MAVCSNTTVPTWAQQVCHFSTVIEAALLLISLALLLRYVYRLYLSPLSKFPGPRFASCSKLFEAYHVLVKNDWLETLQELHRQYGPIVRIGPNELHFSDHQFCLRHHKQADLYKCNNYYGILSYLLGGFASPHHHSERKSIIQPLFAGGSLADFSASWLNTHLDSLIDLIMPLANTSGVNATHILWAYTTDVMMSYIRGIDVGYLKSADLDTLHKQTRAFSAIDLATVLRSMPPVKAVFDFLPWLRRYSPLGWIDESVRNDLHAVRATGPFEKREQQTVLARLWGQLPDERAVIHELSQAVFIGNESLLSNLTVVIHRLIQNPKCVRKLRDELDSLDVGFYGHRIWRDPKVMQLKYLDAICRESTRMSAPGWHRQPRQSLEPVEYGQVIIPPRTSLSFTLKLLEHDPTLYPEPQRFKPERWLDDPSESQLAKKSSVTFGTGTRTCLGQFLARQVLRKTVAALVYNFDMSFVDAEKDRLEGYKYLNTYPKKGHEGSLMIHFAPRFRSC